ncbi:protease inhibitor I42 family protein [Kitasatospora sp. NBC_01287]|uniref:protease inhibitor I42 family protein n=1 Tax=Kitasatospora sp. NBC_01287 TaxID=2903573 RepID=UPI002254F6C0|nr:protease inhibitor I42 family protein [Kitasatospora sp. NBC_01287]MCX4748405.1 protease inhibitor I42 family protein [Kitasatospora sp. NBC_01287]
MNRPRRLLPAAVIGLVLTAALTACGSGAQHATSPSSAAVLTLDDSANRTTVHAQVGSTIEITLHSTYWSAPTSSAPGVLVAAGTSSAPSASAGCHPGSGCGTIETTFRAGAAGTARLTATRTSCGEAKPCAPDQSSYTVTVQVG